MAIISLHASGLKTLNSLDQSNNSSEPFSSRVNNSFCIVTFEFLALHFTVSMKPGNKKLGKIQIFSVLFDFGGDLYDCLNSLTLFRNILANF